MAAITGVKIAQSALPTLEIGTGTASNGETYTSGKFANIDIACAGFMEDVTPNTTNLDVAISTNVATFHCDGITDKKIWFLIVGH